MTFAVHVRICNDDDAIQAIIDCADANFIYEDDSNLWGIGHQGCGANLMSTVLKEVREYYYTGIKNAVIDKELTMSLQTARYLAAEKINQKRASDNTYRIKREARKAKLLDSGGNISKVIKVINSGTEDVTCKHKFQPNRFKPNIVGENETPRIEYVSCLECRMSCIIERKTWTASD
jgi:hypothetical protein